MIVIDPVKLLALSPTAFENLVFDVAKYGDFSNLIWRTPGADGGRDIEGSTYEQDASGAVRQYTWYIECKRYESSVGWPVVWEKISYGDAAQADFILIATTTSFTPRCIEEVDKWNAQHRRPVVRLWPVSEIAFRLQLASHIALKYGLVSSSSAPAAALAGLALEVARMGQAVSGAQATGASAEIYARAAMDLADLLYVRANELDRGTRLSRTSFLTHDKWPAWVLGTAGAALPSLDRHGFLAFASALHVLLRSSPTLVTVKDGSCALSIQKSDVARLNMASKLFGVISLWGLFTVEQRGDEIWLTNQTLN